MMAETDDQGRIYLSKELRERHGERFHVVDLPSRIVLVPIDDDPLNAVRESMGSTLEEADINKIREDTRSAIEAEARRERVDESDQ